MPWPSVHAKLAGGKGGLLATRPSSPGNKTARTGDEVLQTLADVDYGVVRAAFGVAETGSVCLTDEVLWASTRSATCHSI